MKKNKHNKGETIVETVVAILIVVLSLLTLASSMTVVAKCNYEIKYTKTTCSKNRTGYEVESEIVITHEGVEEKINRANGYNIQGYCEEGFYYYDFH